MDWLDVARAQDSIVSRDQLRSCAIADSRVERLIRTRELVRIYPGIFAHRSLRLTKRQRFRAAVMWSGGALSHASAAEVWRLPSPVGVSVHLTIAPSKVLRAPAGIRLHRITLSPEEITVVDDLVVSVRDRTVIDLLASLDHVDAVRLRDDAVRKGILDEKKLNDHIARRSGWAGTTQLRQLARVLEPHTHAESERVLIRLLRAAGIAGWKPQTSVSVNGRTFLLDVGFERARLAIEVDGRAHHDERSDRFESDRVRQNALVNSGWRVLRFTWRRLVDEPDAVIAEIRAAL